MNKIKFEQAKEIREKIQTAEKHLGEVSEAIIKAKNNPGSEYSVLVTQYGRNAITIMHLDGVEVLEAEKKKTEEYIKKHDLQFSKL